MKLLIMKRRPLCVAISGVFLGMAIASPVLALTSPSTMYVIGHAPTVAVQAAGGIGVNDLNNNSVVDIGDELVADEKAFTFTDVDADILKNYTYEWSVDGHIVIGNVTGTYTIAKADLGKTISLKVTANTDSLITDPSISVPVPVKFSDNSTLGITGTPTSLPVAKAGVISSAVIGGLTKGLPLVGTDLNVEVKLADGTIAASSLLNYKWQIETVPASGTFSDIPNETSETYNVKRTDQKKAIRVDVTLKAVAP